MAKMTGSGSWTQPGGQRQTFYVPRAFHRSAEITFDIQPGITDNIYGYSRRAAIDAQITLTDDRGKGTAKIRDEGKHPTANIECRVTSSDGRVALQ